MVQRVGYAMFFQGLWGGARTALAGSCRGIPLRAGFGISILYIGSACIFSEFEEVAAQNFSKGCRAAVFDLRTAGDMLYSFFCPI